MPVEVTTLDVFALLSERYKDRPDDFRLSIGHVCIPFPERPVSVVNLPELQAYMSLEMRDIRRFARELQMKVEVNAMTDGISDKQLEMWKLAYVNADPAVLGLGPKWAIKKLLAEVKRLRAQSRDTERYCAI